MIRWALSRAFCHRSKAPILPQSGPRLAAFCATVCTSIFFSQDNAFFLFYLAVVYIRPFATILCRRCPDSHYLHVGSPGQNNLISSTGVPFDSDLKAASGVPSESTCQSRDHIHLASAYTLSLRPAWSSHRRRIMCLICILHQ